MPIAGDVSMEQVVETTSSTSLAEWANRYVRRIKWISIALIVISVLLIMSKLPLKEGADWFTEWIAGLGYWAPVLYLLVYIAATVLMIPAWILTIVAGSVFGLLQGTALVSVASTTGAALAFLIARYLSRARVARQFEQYPKFAAIDKAIGEGGWKIVAMLRLSPAVPFNLQNYLYGVTSIRFWPYVLTSWVAMLPGTFLYVYIGYTAAEVASDAARAGEGGQDLTQQIISWAFRIVGLLATMAVTIYITRLATLAVKEHMNRQKDIPMNSHPDAGQQEATARTDHWSWGATIMALAAVLLSVTAAGATIRPVAFKGIVLGLFGQQQVVLAETYEARADGPSFDHAVFDALLKKHVDEDGWVDYAELNEDADELGKYIAAVGKAPLNDMGRDEKLALLINAYNVFTLQLILDHWNDGKLESIKDIPHSKRWKSKRWKVGGRTWSLDEIEHKQIRPKFKEPRIHFALVCAAVSCPKLRNEAYRAEDLEQQLADQAAYVHAHDHWFRFDKAANKVYLTRLYDWYSGDFEQVAGSVLQYAADHSPHLKAALDVGKKPRIKWLDYDWKLNWKGNKEE